MTAAFVSNSVRYEQSTPFPPTLGQRKLLHLRIPRCNARCVDIHDDHLDVWALVGDHGHCWACNACTKHFTVSQSTTCITGALHRAQVSCVLALSTAIARHQSNARFGVTPQYSKRTNNGGLLHAAPCRTRVAALTSNIACAYADNLHDGQRPGLYSTKPSSV